MTPRRTFLALIGAAGIGSLTYPVLKFLQAPDNGSGSHHPVRVPIERLNQQGSLTLLFNGKPVIITAITPTATNNNSKQKIFRAYVGTCTHLGCSVRWAAKDQEFICPCHNARFNADGDVLSGPPPTALTPVPISVQGDMMVLGTEG